MPMMVSFRHHHRHSVFYTIMDGIGFALCSGGMPSINGRIVHGEYVDTSSSSKTINIDVSWDYGIITAGMSNRAILLFPTIFTIGMNGVQGSCVYNDGSGYTCATFLHTVSSTSIGVSSNVLLNFVLIAL